MEGCSICLSKVKREARLDSCGHSFCFSCISKWSKVFYPLFRKKIAARFARRDLLKLGRRWLLNHRGRSNNVYLILLDQSRSRGWSIRTNRRRISLWRKTFFLFSLGQRQGITTLNFGKSIAS